MTGDTRSDSEDFYLRVGRALEGCQLVEQELKRYITEALELVKKCVKGKLAFKMSGEDSDNKSLGRLIDTFEQLSDNLELVAALRKFVEQRNILGHTGIARCLDLEGEFDLSATEEFEKKLAAMQPEANRLRIKIREEANKCLVHLDFDPLPDAE